MYVSVPGPPASPGGPPTYTRRTRTFESSDPFGPTLRSEEVIRPEDVADYLAANPEVNSPARFLAALPPEFKQNWILMSRSESLQTGTAQSPRILLPSADARFVFTVGMTEHSSYPGSHHNAIEFMQWDAIEKNFRFHEIAVPPVGTTIPAMGVVSARPRGVSVDDAKCSKCHSTRNVLNLNRAVTPPVPGSTHGTDGIPPGSIPHYVKNKPNWDAYDSWGGMLPFNRDRIYQGAVEAAAFRKTLNLWTWSTSDTARQVIEQLELQPSGVPPAHAIKRDRTGGHINFGFDPGFNPDPAIAVPPVVVEPLITGPPIETPSGTSISPPGTATRPGTYSFNGASGTSSSNVTQGGAFVTLHHSRIPTSDEGRGVRLFDALGGLAGTLNQERIADELINHRFATGSVPIDVRPVALAISSGCVTRPDDLAAPGTPARTFFDQRNGFDNPLNPIRSFASLEADTRARRQNLPRRKADIQRLNLTRGGDPYLVGPTNGQIEAYGGDTSSGVTILVERIRGEVFRRYKDDGTLGSGFPLDPITGALTDREFYETGLRENTKITLFRYFLEPLGVSVDKWSMNVRGRSRAYNFADVFERYISTMNDVVGNSYLGHVAANPSDCTSLINGSRAEWSRLPAPTDVPKYTDVQRVFNKSCVECHGGLRYPPYENYGAFFDLSENETPDTIAMPLATRLTRPHSIASPFATDILNRITATNEDCSPPGTPITGLRLMPCGGPRLSQVDIETIRRWIDGGRLYSEGDPHIKTIDGVNYDFQSAGEFTLLRDENFEVQARQTAVETEFPLPPNPHTGLSSCVSVNTAVAVRIGPHRITYQPNLEGLQLRIDGKLTKMSAEGVPLLSGGRIIETAAAGGLQIEAPGGTVVIITPGWWDYYRLWYLNLDARHVRASEGIMGAIAPQNWLPALPDGSVLGPRPIDLHQRYVDLHQTFANAWRVTDTTSLFDYAPGTSTKTFTIESWPEENPQSCRIPQDIESPPRKPPLKPLKLEEAQQHCKALVAEDRRANCVQDVMVTGESGFAKTYLATEKIERNRVPTAPRLISPENEQTGLQKTVVFMWKQATDPDGDPVTYRHCVWAVDTMPTEENCQKVLPHQMAWVSGDVLYIGLAGLGGSGLILGTLTPWRKKRQGLLSLLAGILLIGTLVSSCSLLEMTTGTDALTRKVQGLDSGRAYFWKVIAQDDKGGSSESETWRFTTK